MEGAGEGVTIITASGSDSATGGTVLGANNAELRLVTVANSGGAVLNAFAIYNAADTFRVSHVTAIASGADSNIAVYLDNAAMPLLRDVNLVASGGSFTSGVYGVISSFTLERATITTSGPGSNFGVNVGAAPAVLQDVTISVSGGSLNAAVAHSSASSTLRNVVARASGGSSYGLYNSGAAATVTIDRSTISGGSNSINNLSSYTIRVGASQLINPVTGTGPFTCVGVYDGNYAPLNNTCQ
ncbi:MAG: hypothetical protein L0332_00610 [Chloroflexi bacterium]|nr:hypothetical protein [Chloroflexota bacterium]MCI0577587.1 hypothetical protein [Chloroflexota bacterium]MCI0644193.1 hypothetical protein [Chloroflexota bacterium]MCI0725224.1 hypothetical protein [Chloroflexota bacterium]